MSPVIGDAVLLVPSPVSCEAKASWLVKPISYKLLERIRCMRVLLICGQPCGIDACGRFPDTTYFHMWNEVTPPRVSKFGIQRTPRPPPERAFRFSFCGLFFVGRFILFEASRLNFLLAAHQPPWAGEIEIPLLF